MTDVQFEATNHNIAYLTKEVSSVRQQAINIKGTLDEVLRQLQTQNETLKAIQKALEKK